MSDMHVLDGDGSSFRVVMHFPVPTGNNFIGVAWVDALVNSGEGTTVLVDGDGNDGTIDATEKAAIVAGTVLERVVLVHGIGEGTNPGRVSLLRERYAAHKSAETTKLKSKLNFFGHTESEA